MTLHLRMSVHQQWAARTSCDLCRLSLAVPFVNAPHGVYRHVIRLPGRVTRLAQALPKMMATTTAYAAASAVVRQMWVSDLIEVGTD